MGGLCCRPCCDDEETIHHTDLLNECSRDNDSINVNSSNHITSATNTSSVRSVSSNLAETGVRNTKNDNGTSKFRNSENVINTPRNYSTTSRVFPPLVHSASSNYSDLIRKSHCTSNHPTNVNTRVWTTGVNQEKISTFHRDVYLDLKNGMYDSNYFPICKRRILFSTSPIYKVLPVQENGREYWNIKRRITNRYFIIHSIEKIENQLLESSYLLKKEQKLKLFPYLEELELFHGTKWAYADSICKNNFNWRFTGKEVGHIFGRGVCFSCNAMYAANYSDKDEDEKVMFIAKVMIGRKCVGKYNMKLPPAGCDTTTKQNDNIVVVKYDDNEYYPIYRIKFHIAPGYVPLKQRDGSQSLLNK